MEPSQINTIFQKLQQSIPSPVSELDYDTPFQLLIAVMLSAQTTDKRVNLITPELFHRYPTPQAMAEASETELLAIIRSVGLAPTKAKNIIQTCQQLLSHHDGVIPNDRDALESLPGVGRKTANVLLNISFQQPVIAVDTHVFRVSQRLGLVQAKTVLETEKQLMVVVPDAWKMNAHHYLILHGRHTCTARSPHCGSCVLQLECDFLKSQHPST